MREDDILARIRQKLPEDTRFGTGLVLGIGDDAAIYRPTAGEDLVFTTDMMHEERHFLRIYRAADVGWKALARGLSDIAAMGATPRFALLSLAVGPWVKTRWIDSFFDGFLELAALHHLPLAGGDLARAAHTSMDVVVCGSTRRGKAFRRDGAHPGDTIYVSGQLGGGVLGLRDPQRREARRKHLRPEPRIALGLALQRYRPSAAMDLSDGLSTDLARLCRASGVQAELTADLPRIPGASLEDALHGGDDYELLFTASSRQRIPDTFEGLTISPVGTITEGAPGLVIWNGKPLRPQGWDHFSS